MAARSRPLNCAHRGASGYAPENTLAAMRLALQMGADMAELDVQQTADDALVVIHDTSLHRTTDGRGKVWRKSLKELKEFDAGSWFAPEFKGERVPLLTEVIELVRGKMRLNIEVKLHGHERDVVSLLLECLRREEFIDSCIVTSFGHEVAAEIKRRAPALQVGCICDRHGFREQNFTARVDLLSVQHRLVDADFMEKARAAGKQVHVWTVNDTSRMRQIIELGADAIITNYPDRLATLLAAA